MKIAIIGAGISGLSAAYYLHQQHEISVFEKAERIGGHTATIDVEQGGKEYAVDTGFIVFNDRTYPHFIELMDELGVTSKNTEMSFSVKAQDALEYGGSGLNALFAQRRNLLNPSHWFMIRDILRFNKEVLEALDKDSLPKDLSLGQYLESNGYGQAFKEKYLVPMGCAIWSASTQSMLDFPLYFFARFFKNHGLLSINNRPQWKVIQGGSRSYLAPLTEGFQDKIVTDANIVSVTRLTDKVSLSFSGGRQEQFDEVIFACHSDQALALLTDTNDTEQQILGAMAYQKNEVVLHTDIGLLPKKRLAWSSWNYWLRESVQSQSVLTYNMNILQGIESDTTFCVTLNASDAIDKDKIIQRFEYSHPVFTDTSVEMSQRWREINGVNRTWFAGAYWGNGFHEDGVSSGKRIARLITDRIQPIDDARADTSTSDNREVNHA